MINCPFDVTSSSLVKNLGRMSIADLIFFESKQFILKSLNNQAPQYMWNFFQGNSECSSQDLRDTATEMRLPMNTCLNGQKRFPTTDPNYGMPLQLRLKRHPPLQC